VRKFTILIFFSTVLYQTIFVVKIIFISRDPRAIAASGYPFFGGMEKYQPMFDLYNIKNVDDFAKILFQV